MSIIVALEHRTHYDYDRPISLGPQVVRLRPAPHTRSRIQSYSFAITPERHFLNWQQDPFSNHLARLVFPEVTNRFRVDVGLVLEMEVFNPFDFFLEAGAKSFPFAYDAAVLRDLRPYLATEKDQAVPAAFLAGFSRVKDESTVDFLVRLNRYVHRHVAYLIRLEPGVQAPEETLRKGSGSCRDSAWLLVQCLRSLGLAARFVSGYLIQLKADVPALEGPDGPDADFTDLHAWCEAYLPGAGWVGLDPTSGLLAGEGHIPLACTPDPQGAAPVSGALDPCEVSFRHEMSVKRLIESPRVTFPYAEEVWNRILDLGDRVDDTLDREDVRLTMGGEPTFVSATDRDAPEWNTEALGPTKRSYAIRLVHALREKYGEGGFLHFGQGKWYPGEPLPRWALSIFWRNDGQQIWSDPGLFADERAPGDHDIADAQRLMMALIRQLGLGQAVAMPAFEDTWYYLWRERRLPVNVDPFDSRLDDEHERARLRRVFGQGLAATVGYALPLRPADETSTPGSRRWETGSWFLRDERLYLIPGDSPMGWRLPLDSLPWATPSDLDPAVARDPYGEFPPLPTRRDLAALRMQNQAGSASMAQHPRQAGTTGRAQPARFESAAQIVRTALCIEPRQGHLYVFMPPLTRLEDYLELLAALEAATRETGVRVVLEGYPPPRDPRLAGLQVTPDPGVIEVNIHPSANWRELVERTEHLYEAARRCGLCADKFLVDGKHAGTGGGNHVVLGGKTVADSPLLRRPDLLASLLRYWHNHPSLSYVFCGLFIGPTSQAPRIDEARNDQVAELEIALDQLARTCPPGHASRPWMVDRLLRNILIDVTGNTHRAEFCIDKLYSPDGPTGRLGLLELRAFEMPPHARMSLVQQLLLRAIVARCWSAPYQERLSRWGTQLHDRFLLPSFLEMDLEDVLEDLGAHGFGFDAAWFAPHLAFRFPTFGETAARGVSLQVRSALEPWHVMGEEGASGGTVRYVDSSLERLEILVRGMNDRRYRVTVNGVSLPLHPTGISGEFVAGLRFRAWQPASALHPTIGVHAPLRIDIVDTWNRRAISGCTYHVMHPGGRNFDTLPINAFEAESRRRARFFRMEHTSGLADPPSPVHNAEFPLTLDLRRG